MALTPMKKVGIGFLVLFFIVWLIVPPILGIFLRGTVEEKIKLAINAPVKLGGLSITLLPAGAVLKDLEVGEAAAENGGLPLVKIQKVTASVPYGVVLGGPIAVSKLDIYGADVHSGVDGDGKATLEKFLAAMPISDRKTPLPIDYFRVRESKITLHVADAVLGPGSGKKFDPVTYSLSDLIVRGLVLGAPGEPLPADAKVQISISELKLRSPIQGVTVPPDAPEAGPALEEGLDLRLAEGSLTFPAGTTNPLSVGEVTLSGLNIRNILVDKSTPDTMFRLSKARELCLKSPPLKPGEKGMVLGNGSFQVDEFIVKDSIEEVSGPNGKGEPCYYRLTNFSLEGKKLGIGKGARVMPDQTGFLKIASDTKSNEGDGKISMDWTNLSGAYPNWSFDKKFVLSGLALSTFSTRAEHASGATIEHGTMASQFSGTAKDGKLDWKGNVIISKDTKMGGSGLQAYMVSSLSKFATGDPIGPIKVGGTLADPKVQMPDFLAGGAFDVLSKAVTGDQAGIFSMFNKAMGSAVDEGIQETQKVIQKVPGLGGLFGGKK